MSRQPVTPRGVAGRSAAPRRQTAVPLNRPVVLTGGVSRTESEPCMTRAVHAANDLSTTMAGGPRHASARTWVAVYRAAGALVSPVSPLAGALAVTTVTVTVTVTGGVAVAAAAGGVGRK